MFIVYFLQAANINWIIVKMYLYYLIVFIIFNSYRASTMSNHQYQKQR